MAEPDCEVTRAAADDEVEDLVRLVRDRAVTRAGVLKVWEHWFGPGSSLADDPATLDRLTGALSHVAPNYGRNPPGGASPQRRPARTGLATAVA
jgi:hypothetical protein